MGHRPRVDHDLLALGCFMDHMAILVLTVPVVAPLMQSLRFNLVWFGVIKIVAAEFGMITPPLGLNAFVVAKYPRTTVSEMFIGAVPYVIAHALAKAILLPFPGLTLRLPSKMG